MAVFGVADEIFFADFDAVFVLESQIVMIVISSKEDTGIEEDPVVESFDNLVDLWDFFEIDIGIDHVAVFGTELFEQ